MLSSCRMLHYVHQLVCLITLSAIWCSVGCFKSFLLKKNSLKMVRLWAVNKNPELKDTKNPPEAAGNPKKPECFDPLLIWKYRLERLQTTVRVNSLNDPLRSLYICCSIKNNSLPESRTPTPAEPLVGIHVTPPRSKSMFLKDLPQLRPRSGSPWGFDQ